MTYKYSNKIDALTVILRKLNNRERVTVGILTEELGVGERTIYRYLEHLQAAGYPLYFDRGAMSYRFTAPYKLAQSPVEHDLAQVLDLDRQVVWASPVAIAVYRRNGECVLGNEAMGRLLGIPDATMFGRNFRGLVGWSTSGLLDAAEEVLRTGREQVGDYRLVAENGREVCFHCTLASIERGGERYLVMTAQDLALRIKKELQVARFFAAINQHAKLIVMTDTDGTIRYVGDRVRELTGYDADEVIGKNPRIFKSHLTSPDQHAHLWNTIKSGIEWSGELYNRRKDGSHYWEHLRVSPIFDADGSITHYVAFKEDITRQKELDEELYHYAVLDHLTGVYNRRMLLNLGNREISLARRYERPITLLVLDVDSLTRINHIHGHPVGDGVLRQVVRICREQMRATDILARVEADSFALLLPEADRHGAYHVAERIRRQVADTVFTGAGGTFSCTVSIGGAPLSAAHQGVECMLRVSQRLLQQQRSGSSDRVVGFYGDTAEYA